MKKEKNLEGKKEERERHRAFFLFPNFIMDVGIGGKGGGKGFGFCKISSRMVLWLYFS